MSLTCKTYLAVAVCEIKTSNKDTGVKPLTVQNDVKLSNDFIKGLSFFFFFFFHLMTKIKVVA